MTTKPRAIAYCRQSKGRDNETADDALSIDAQLAAITRYCDDRGYTLVKTVRDHDISGEDWHRPGVRDLLAAAEQGEADIAVVFKMSRFSRDGLYQELTHRELKNRGVKLESVTEAGIDKPLIRMVYGGMAQQANEDLRDFLKATFASRARRGLHHGFAPFGYEPIQGLGRTKRYAFAEPGASIVRRIFQRRLDGLGCGAIADELNAAGLRTRTGRLWYGETVRHVLGTASYAGYAVHQGAIVGDLDPELWPALIDRATWQAVRRTFRPGQRQPQRDKRVSSWLEGRVFHACGAPMWLTNDVHAHDGGFRCSTRKKARAARCGLLPVSIAKHALETAATMAIVADLDARYRDPDAAIRALLAAQNVPEIADQRALLRKQREQTIAAMKRAERLVMMGMRDEQWLAESDRELNAELAAIDAQLAEYVDVPDPADLTAHIAALNDIAATFALASDADKRALLAVLGDVVYAGGVVSLRYHREIAALIPSPTKITVHIKRGNPNHWEFQQGS